MAAGHSESLATLIVKLESTSGTPEWDSSSTFPVTADHVIRVRNIQYSPTVGNDGEPGKYASGHHGSTEAIMGEQMCEVTFEVYAAYNTGGSVATAPKWWTLMQMCGFVTKTYTTVGIALQDRKSADCTTGTIGIIEPQVGQASPSALLTTISGAFGSFEYGAEMGKPHIVSFTFTGKLEGQFDMNNTQLNAAALGTTDTTIAEKLLGSPLTIGGVAQKISSFSLASGNNVQPLIDQSDATGYEAFYVSDKQPRFTCNPRQALVAADPAYDDWKAGNVDVITLTTAASSPNATIHIPRAQRIAMGREPREGIIANALEFKILGDFGSDANVDDESSIEILQGSRT